MSEFRTNAATARYATRRNIEDLPDPPAPADILIFFGCLLHGMHIADNFEAPLFWRSSSCNCKLPNNVFDNFSHIDIIFHVYCNKEK